MTTPQPFQRSPEQTLSTEVVGQIQAVDFDGRNPRDFYDVALPAEMHKAFGEKAPQVIVTPASNYTKVDVVGEPQPGLPPKTPIRTFFVFPKGGGYGDEVRFKDTALVNGHRQLNPDTLIADIEQIANVRTILGNLSVQATATQ